MPGCRYFPEDGAPGSPRPQGGGQTCRTGRVLSQLHPVDPPHVQLEGVVLHTVAGVAADRAEVSGELNSTQLVRQSRNYWPEASVENFGIWSFDRKKLVCSVTSQKEYQPDCQSSDVKLKILLPVPSSPHTDTETSGGGGSQSQRHVGV